MAKRPRREVGCGPRTGRGKKKRGNAYLRGALGQAALGEGQRPRPLPRRQHRLGGAAAVTQLPRHPGDEPLEGVLGQVGLPPPGVDLRPPQLVIVAVPALVPLAVGLLPLVDGVERLGRVAEALDCLERGCEERNALAWWFRESAAFDPLRSDPRHIVTVHRLGYKFTG